MQRCNRHPRIAIVTAASCLFIMSSESAAQSDSSRARTIGVRLAIGTSLDRYSTLGTDTELLGMLGLHWQRPGSRLSGRLELSGQWQTRRSASFQISCEECVSESERRLVGLSLDGQYDLTRSAVRPYILSGIGVYHAALRSQQNFHCTSPSPLEPPECTGFGEMRTFWDASSLAIELHAGAGLGVTIGRATLFGEARYSLLSGDWVADGWRMPVLVGLRF